MGAAATFVVTFGLPAILSPPGEVHRMAGGMFTISYGIALVVPVICGACWDLTGLPWTSFMPMVACAVGMTIFGTALTMQSARRQSAKQHEDRHGMAVSCSSRACSKSAGRSG